MTCMISTPETLPKRAIDNMGITLNASRSEFDPRALVRCHLGHLTARELDICVLHFIEGQPQLTIAEWLGMTDRAVRLFIEGAIKKVPQLKRLQVQTKAKIQRPKIFHLSQLRPTERGPFNADEV